MKKKDTLMPSLNWTRRNYLKTVLAAFGATFLPQITSSTDVVVKESALGTGPQHDVSTEVLTSQLNSNASVSTAFGATTEVANVMAYGASGDGVTDDSTAIQNAVTNHKLVYLPPGIYLCNDVNIPANRIVFGNGDAILKPAIATEHALNLQGDNITLRGLTIQGTGLEFGLQCDLAAADLDNIRVEHCRFLDLNNAIRVKSADVPSRTISNVYIVNCEFNDIEDKAINLTVSPGVPYSIEDFHIEKNLFVDIAEESSGQGYNSAIYIGKQTGVARFYVRDNVAYRAGPQFLVLAATTNPSVDFVVTGNTVRQQGPSSVIHMSYTFEDVDNLVFSDNSCYYVEYEHVLLRNCRNFKITNSHFENANVGIAVIDKGPGEHCWGEISNCTFVDIECPTNENDGNKAIFVSADAAEIDVSNCRFIKRNGVKGQIGLDINYFNEGAKWAKFFDPTVYQWVQDVSACYYLQKIGGGDPEVLLPVEVYEKDNILVAGQLGSLAAGQWAWGDNNALGYNTIYVRKLNDGLPSNNEVSAGYPRLGINIANCRFERLAGITVSSGGTLDYPGYARVTNCSFKKCSIGVRFTFPVGNVVAFCNFESCNTDIRASRDANGLRCVHNLHLNTNPNNSASSGAYVLDAGKGYNSWEISGCTFRNVKNIQMIDGGAINPSIHTLVFRDNDIDAVSTGLPSV